jgi:hypothetical protein
MSVRNGHASNSSHSTPQPAPSEPSADGGRQTGGRFARGNKFSKGNPHAARLAKNRSLLLEHFDEAKLKEILNRLYWDARSGDKTAIQLVLQYCIGRPLPMPNPDPEEDHGETEAGGQA